jgi:hypothetical protein
LPWTYSASAFIPDEKRSASGTIRPFSSRFTCQQSSITTYW